MGRFTLPVFQEMKTLVLSLLFLSLSIHAREVEGVKIAPTMKCEGKDVPISGAGVRTATFLKVRIFVLAVYAPQKIKTGQGSELDQRPLCFEMTYLRAFDNEDVDKAWDFQFEESAQYQYPNLKDHIMDIKKFFGEIKGDRRQSFSLTEDATKVYENGELKGEIQGKEFQKSFLSIWFGKNPPTKHLQEEILKNE